MAYEKLAAAGIDMDGLLQRLMNNTSLIKLFVSKFIADNNYQILVNAFHEKDMQKAETASHTLKGMCGNMSLNALFALFTEQVNLLRNGDYDKAESMMTEISAAYSTAIDNMNAWLSENK